MTDEVKKYNDAWEQYKKSEAYKSIADCLLNYYKGKQPYVDNIIIRVFQEGFFMGSKTVFVKPQQLKKFKGRYKYENRKFKDSMNEVKHTYLILDNGVLRPLYETWERKYFTTCHIVGQVVEIEQEKAVKLIQGKIKIT